SGWGSPGGGLNKYCIQHLRSARPRQRGSVDTRRSISLRHKPPSATTRRHSLTHLHTASAAHRLRASRYDNMASATWKVTHPFLGSKEMKSRCNMGLRKVLMRECWQ
ncbi:unnamed protein product, partial [Ixodes hexagonus]